MNDTSWSYLKDWDLLINITDVLIDMGTYPGKQGNLSSPAYEKLHAYPCPGMPPKTKQCGIMVRSLPPSLVLLAGPYPRSLTSRGVLRRARWRT